MPYISMIIAKVLAFADAFLAQWATAVPASANTACYGAYTINAEVTPCGATFITQIMDIREGLIQLTSALLAARYAG
jgi:hypothetical protein